MFESVGVTAILIVNGSENRPSAQLLVPLTFKNTELFEAKFIEISFTAVAPMITPSNSHSYKVAFAIGATLYILFMLGLQTEIGPEIEVASEGFGSTSTENSIVFAHVFATGNTTS